jgi:hypothetical protein
MSEKRSVTSKGLPLSTHGLREISGKFGGGGSGSDPTEEQEAREE